MSSEADSEVMCVRYSHDGRLLAAGFADGYVRVSRTVAVFISSLFVKLLMDIYTGDRVKFAINVAQHLAV